MEKLSIKNLLFTKAIPNHEIPPTVQVDGRKIFPCTDCGDKFLFEISYEDHVNRKSVLITYVCRHCNQTKIFYNRCRLLSHIRSHSFKTATINVQDLKVEPIPLGLYKPAPNSQVVKITQPPASESPKKSQTVCIECKKLLPSFGITYKDRAAHLMQYTNETYSCPVCLFTLPTMCAIRTHMRFHLKYPPYYCPECGVNITNKNVHYPFNHDCEGFRMMRVTARLKCPVDECQLLHPNEFKDHMKDSHIKKVFKCPVCVVACFNEPTMQNHLNSHNTFSSIPKALIFYQCELCPGRLVLQNHIDNHLRTHVNSNVFPCWTCGMVFKEVFALIDHHVKKHFHQMTDAVKAMFTSTIHESENQYGKPKRIYRVVKRCDQCKRNFTYKCKYNEISILPNECPYKCTSKLKSSIVSDSIGRQITCHICTDKIPYDWQDIKKHYAAAHKNHRCLEPKIIINKMDRFEIDKYTKRCQNKVTKRTRKKRRQVMRPSSNEQNTPKIPVTTLANSCSMCGNVCENKEMLEAHLKTHRDPCMAYQCLECGQSFVVKPSFSKHLMLAHGIDNTEAYIISKECYNENALDKHQKSDIPMTPPKENQCTICMDQFQSSEDLEKHFRVHGMAFLLKNTSNNKEHSSPKTVSDKDSELSSSPT